MKPWAGIPVLCRTVESALSATAMRGLLLAVSCGSPLLANAADRFDHRGALGLLLGPGFAVNDRVRNGQISEESARPAGMLGGTLAIGADGNELKLFVQGLRSAGSFVWDVCAGYRGYFGQERIKTFFDLDARLDITPSVAIGPRLGFGIQFEALPNLGIFAGLGAHGGIGNGLVFGAELFIGVQLRSYLLE